MSVINMTTIPRAVLESRPQLHSPEPGVMTSWALEDEALAFISNAVLPSHTTLETGAGISTAIFAARQSTHYCLMPDADLATRVASYCAEVGFSTVGVKFVINTSENELPRMTVPLDFVLIDGRHAFPTPFIDWYYTARLLRVGGFLMIDDTQLWPCQMLREFLLTEPEWAIDKQFLRTVVFRKIAPVCHDREWNQQTFVIRKSRRSILQHRARVAARLISHAQFGVLIDKSISVLRHVTRSAASSCV